MSELTGMDRAIAAQSELANALSSVRGVNGIGVGAGREPGTYALYVAVSDKRAAKSAQSNNRVFFRGEAACADRNRRRIRNWRHRQADCARVDRAQDRIGKLVGKAVRA